MRSSLQLGPGGSRELATRPGRTARFGDTLPQLLFSLRSASQPPLQELLGGASCPNVETAVSSTERWKCNWEPKSPFFKAYPEETLEDGTQGHSLPALMFLSRTLCTAPAAHP